MAKIAVPGGAVEGEGETVETRAEGGKGRDDWWWRMGERKNSHRAKTTRLRGGEHTEAASGGPKMVAAQVAAAVGSASKPLSRNFAGDSTCSESK